MKALGFILIAVGLLSFFGSTFISEIDYAPGVRLLGLLLQIGLVIGGFALISKSNKKG